MKRIDFLFLKKDMKHLQFRDQQYDIGFMWTIWHFQVEKASLGQSKQWTVHNGQFTQWITVYTLDSTQWTKQWTVYTMDDSVHNGQYTMDSLHNGQFTQLTVHNGWQFTQLTVYTMDDSVHNGHYTMDSLHNVFTNITLNAINGIYIYNFLHEIRLSLVLMFAKTNWGSYNITL